MNDSIGNQNKSEAGVDFSKSIKAPADMSPKLGEFELNSEPIEEDGFIIKFVYRISGNTITTLTGVKLVLGALIVVLILTSIVIYLYFGTPKKGAPKVIVPNPPINAVTK